MKKFISIFIVVAFVTTLITPVSALEYDPKNRKQKVEPNGDTDPWNEWDIQETPPPKSGYITLFTLYILYSFDIILPPTNDDTDREKVTLESRDRRIIKKTSNRQIIY